MALDAPCCAAFPSRLCRPRQRSKRSIVNILPESLQRDVPVRSVHRRLETPDVEVKGWGATRPPADGCCEARAAPLSGPPGGREGTGAPCHSRRGPWALKTIGITPGSAGRSLRPAKPTARVDREPRPRPGVCRVAVGREVSCLGPCLGCLICGTKEMS